MNRAPVAEGATASASAERVWQQCEAAARAFDTARCTGGQATLDAVYLLADRRVRFRLVGSELAATVSRPFRHLRDDTASTTPPDLCVDLWDEEATGVAAPALEKPTDLTVTTLDGAEVVVCDVRLLTYRFSQTRAWFDRSARRVLGAVISARRLSLQECSKPVHVLLGLWLFDSGVQPVHGALVATERGGVLLLGASGAGKSTCAALCVSAGLTYLGDDFVALSEDRDGSFTGHALFGTGRVVPEQMHRFPEALSHTIPGRPPAEPKALVLWSQAYPQRVAASVALRAVALPRVGAEEHTVCTRTSKAEALRAFVSGSLFTMLPGPDRRTVERLARLIDRVPAYRLDLGRDFPAIPHRIAQLAEGQA
jgi:hypothetical protein